METKKKKKGPQPFTLIVAIVCGVALLVGVYTRSPDDTGLLAEMSLPFIIGGVVLAVMGIGFGIAFYYHRKKEKAKLEELGR